MALFKESGLLTFTGTTHADAVTSGVVVVDEGNAGYKLDGLYSAHQIHITGTNTGASELVKVEAVGPSGAFFEIEAGILDGAVLVVTPSKAVNSEGTDISQKAGRYKAFRVTFSCADDPGALVPTGKVSFRSQITSELT